METVAFDLSKYFSQRLAKRQQNKTIKFVPASDNYCIYLPTYLSM